MRKLDKFLTIIFIIVLGAVILILLFSSALPVELRRTRGAGITGLVLSFFGTLLLATTLLKPDREIKNIASNTTWNGNMPKFEKGMFKDRRYALAGLILIGLGFLCQFLDIIVSYYQS